MFRGFGDWTYEGQETIIDGTRAAQLFTATATHTSELFGVEATHRKFKVQGVLVFELRDGKIQAERRLYDFTSLLLQLGVLKAKPGK
jgi:predicted ester cyclase